MPGDKFIELADAPDHHVLDVLFGDAREAVTIQDRSGRLVYANDPAGRMMGFASGDELMKTPVDRLMTRFQMVDESRRPLAADLLPGRRVLAGEDVTEITVGYRAPGSTSIRWSRLNASPVRNDAGEVVWAINYFLDITAQVRLRERERVLKAVSEALAESLWKGPSLKALSSIIVPDVASWCGFHLVDDFGFLSTDAIAYPDSPEATALLGMVDPGPIDPASDQMQARVMATGDIEIIEDITEEMLEAAGAENEALARQIRLLDIGSVYCLPLGVRGTRFGTMTLMRDRADGPLDRTDLSLVEEIAARAGTALANIRLFEREHRTADALRRGLTPERIPTIDGLEIAARYLPLARTGHVGGDFYDVVVVDGRGCALVMGDIEGKGIEAAAAVGVVRQTLKTAIALESSADSIISHLNRELFEASNSRMCTLAHLFLERADSGFKGTVTLAGHPPPMLIRRGGEILRLGEPCPPLGVLAQVEPIPVQFDLEVGDTIVLYTDGFGTREQHSPEMLETLLARMGPLTLHDLANRIVGDFNDMVETIFDDRALMLARIVQ